MSAKSNNYTKSSRKTKGLQQHLSENETIAGTTKTYPKRLVKQAEDFLSNKEPIPSADERSKNNTNND